MLLPNDSRNLSLARNCLIQAVGHLEKCWPRPETQNLPRLKALKDEVAHALERVQLTLDTGDFPPAEQH